MYSALRRSANMLEVLVIQVLLKKMTIPKASIVAKTLDIIIQ